MNIKTAENIQCEFEYLVLDGYFPIHFASHGQERSDWQFAVEFIYRLLVCELAVLEPVWFSSKKDIQTFCQSLARQNPLSEKNDAWYRGEVVLAKKGLDLVRTHMPQAFEEWNGRPFQLNIPFMEALAAIFADYDVAWDENNPLLPVQPF